ncbi:hypothetical protein [Streptomyces sp. NPDC055056]
MTQPDGRQSFPGRTDSRWEVRDLLLRPGHLRPSGPGTRAGGATRMVRDASAGVYGALRVFPDRRSRSDAASLLAAGSPVTPALLDLVDHPDLPPSLVTAWSPGSSTKPLSALMERDDLAAMLDEGHRWTPAAALQLLVPLGRTLDDLAQAGFTPVELSPDHLVVNSGSLSLVGLGRHGYLPAHGRMPETQGMSLPTTLLLGDDLPVLGVGLPVQWREVQLRALIRLAGWMACGLPPASWGSVRGLSDLGQYLQYAGFAQMPALRPGRLAEDLATAAEAEEAARARRDIAGSAALLVYEDPAQVAVQESRSAWVASLAGRTWQAEVAEVKADRLFVNLPTGGPQAWRLMVERWDTPEALELRQSGGLSSRLDLRELYRPGQRVAVEVGEPTGQGQGPHRWPKAKGKLVRAVAAAPRPMLRRAAVEINPEPVRLGLLHDHGPAVLALAAFTPSREGTKLATQLSGAGWVLVAPDQLARQVARATAAAPSARVVAAGRLSPAVQAAAGGSHRQLEQVDPHAPTDCPAIAGRPADQLPYLTDQNLDAYHQDVLGGGSGGGQSLRRRTFAAGWTLALGRVDALPAKRRSEVLEMMAACFGANTELLVAVRARQNSPGLRASARSVDRGRTHRLVTALSGVPSSEFRTSLMSALLGTSFEDLFDETDRRLLPVSASLAQVFRPDDPIGPAHLTMEDALRQPQGIRRVALYGRLCTAVPEIAPDRLAESVAGMDDSLVAVLSDVPAPSLQFLAGRLEDPALLAMLQPHLDGPDLDLLGRYTPAMWRLLLDGIRQPEYLGTLGLGWVQVVAQDPGAAVDARVLVQLATYSGLSPKQTVRALLATALDQWETVCERPGLAAAWLADEGTLAVRPVLERFPDAETLLPRFGTGGLRHAAELDLGQQHLLRVGDFAEALELAPRQVLTVLLERDYGADGVEQLDRAASEWCRWQLRRRIASGRSEAEALSWAVGNAVERRDRIMRWAVYGERLDQRIAEQLLGRPAPDREEARAVLDQVGKSRQLLPLLAQLKTPAERSALLVLHRRSERELGDLRVPSQLAQILAEPDPASALDGLVFDDLTVPLQRAARRLQLGPEARRTLVQLAPMAELLSDRALIALVAVATAQGLEAAATTAVLEQSLPEASTAVAGWGPAWLPLLAGRSGRRVLRLLLEQQSGHSAHAAQLTPWLLAAGIDGIALVERFGSDALTLVRETRAHPRHARLLGELLMLPGPSARLYRLITANGLPAACWPRAARLLADGAEDQQVLLDLWCGPETAA